MHDDITISVCVPAFNEEKNLTAAVEDLIFSLSSRVGDLEIIIVNDGSSDSTGIIANNLVKKYSEIQVINNNKNYGIGFCYKSALEKSSCNYFTWFPGDHENSAQELVRCLGYLHDYDVVTTHHRGFDKRSFNRRSISILYTYILNICFNLDLKYYNGLTIFPVSVLRSFPLRSTGFSLFAENIIRALRRGCNLKELSAPLKSRKSGKSKAFSCSSIFRMIKDLVAIISNGYIVFE